MEAGNIFISTLVVLCVPALRKFFFGSSKQNQEISSPRERIIFFDFARGIAITAVVLIHVVSIMIDNGLFHSSIIPNFINACLRFAIPIFFIVSGSVLTLKDTSFHSLLPFYQSKFFRIIVPYILVVSAISLWRGEMLGGVWKHILMGDSFLPFYFIPVLIQFYILYPIIAKFRNSSWLLPSSFAVSCISFFIPQLWYVYSIPFFPRFFFFFVYGVVKRNDFLTQDNLLESRFLGRIKIPAILVGLYFFLFFLLPDYYYNIQLIFGVAVFHIILYLFYYRKVHQYVSRFFSYLGKISLWVFLLHYPLVELMIRELGLISGNPFLIFCLSFVISFVLTVGLSVIFRGLYGRLLELPQKKKT